MNNPLHNLLLVAGLIYGSKIMDAIPNVTKVNKLASPIKNQPESVPMLTNDPELNYAAFKKEFEQEITMGISKRKQSRDKVIKWLNDNGTALRLKKKWNIK